MHEVNLSNLFLLIEFVVLFGIIYLEAGINRIKKQIKSLIEDAIMQNSFPENDDVQQKSKQQERLDKLKDKFDILNSFLGKDEKKCDKIAHEDYKECQRIIKYINNQLSSKIVIGIIAISLLIMILIILSPLIKTIFFLDYEHVGNLKLTLFYLFFVILVLFLSYIVYSFNSLHNTKQLILSEDGIIKKSIKDYNMSFEDYNDYKNKYEKQATKDDF